MPRKVKEWIASHDDQKIPDRVRLRIFDKYEGICQLSGIKILPGMDWEADHIKALWKGGEHRETNLWPVLKQPQKLKSTTEKSEKAKEDGIRKKHLGIRTKPKTKIKAPISKKKSDPNRNKRDLFQNLPKNSLLSRGFQPATQE